jgi:hypothetical protein
MSLDISAVIQSSIQAGLWKALMRRRWADKKGRLSGGGLTVSAFAREIFVKTSPRILLLYPPSLATK